MMYDRVWLAGMLVAASFCGGALATLLLGGRVEAQGPRAVTTPQVNLVDDGGALRGVLSASDESGGPSLALHDGEGRVRGRFRVGPSGAPAFDLFNADGAPRFSARLTGDDDTLVVVGDDQRRHSVLGTASGTPVLSFADGRRGRLQMQLGSGGAPSVILFGGDGQRSAALTVDAGDTPLLTLYEAGRPRVTLGVVQQAALINMSGAAESRLVIGVAAEGRASVTFIDEQGQVVAELP